MKIAFLCNIYPAPTHTFIRREIQGLEENGIEVERITIRRSEGVLPTPEDRAELEKTIGILEQGAVQLFSSILVVGVKQPLRLMNAALITLKLGARSESGLIKHFAYLAEACVVLRLAWKKGFTHIHSHFGTNATTVAMLVKRLGGPTYSFTIHGPGEWDCPEFLHIPRKVAEAEFVAVISDFAKSQTFRWSDPTNWHKVHVIRCGVDRSFLGHDVTSVSDTSRLVMVGRLGRSKGHLVLLEALEKLLSEGVDFKMVFVGDGPLRDLIENQVSARGLRGNVIFTGWMDNNSVRNELLSCRGMVLPSFGEGLPVVIMEALALARPVICTRIAGISELVVDGGCGWLVNAGNVDELVDSLRALLTTPVPRLSNMGAFGRDAVLQKHDSLAESSKLAALVRSYCGQPNGEE